MERTINGQAGASTTEDRYIPTSTPDKSNARRGPVRGSWAEVLGVSLSGGDQSVKRQRSEAFKVRKREKLTMPDKEYWPVYET